MFRHQEALAARIVSGRRVAGLVPPGYGKTAATLTGLADLKAWPALVVAPARVARTVWQTEKAQWEHLTNLTVSHIGEGLRRESWDGSELEDAHVETVSYEQLPHLIDALDLEKRYRAVVFDELDKMKTPGSTRFKKMRQGCADIPIRVGLTGTPLGNHLLDLWGEMFMVAGEEPLGPTFTDFQARYFETLDFKGYNWTLKHSPDCGVYDKPERPCQPCRQARESETHIFQRIAPWSYTVKAEGSGVVIPPVHVNTIECEWPSNLAALTKHLEKELWVRLDSGEELEALGQSVVAQKLRQLAGGAVYMATDKLGLKPKWEEVHRLKLDALGDLLDELQGEPLLLFYWFDHEYQRLVQFLTERKARWADLNQKDAEGRWNARQFEVLLVHPQSAGHGLNLQKATRHVCWFTEPWSWGQLHQGDSRVARTGCPWDTVISHRIRCGPTDARVAAILGRKKAQEGRLFAAL